MVFETRQVVAGITIDEVVEGGEVVRGGCDGG